MRFASLVRSKLLHTLALTAASGLTAPNVVHAQSTAPPVVSKEANPSWLTPRILPKLTADRLAHVQDGRAYLLSDWQVRATADGYDSYYRFASKVIDRSGLEGAGQISLSFDPRIENVALNFVHVVRDGKVIDRTAEVQFSIVERENDLSQGIVSGNLTAISNLKDIRVGDVIDYATTRHTRTALWPNHYFSSFIDRFSEPLAMRAIRILWPSSQPLNIKVANSAIAFSETDAGEMKQWEWIGIDQPFGPGEANVPAWYPQYGGVDVSTMKSWGEVARWATALYQGDESLPVDFEARLTDIAKRWPSAEDRLTEVTRYIQDNIRYVGEEIGQGSYVPRRPKLVLERGYGDCKDKSLLLSVALRRLGIDAVPALVATQTGRNLRDRLPSPLMFDHVIVRVTLADRVLWIDPTATHRGGRGLNMVPADLGYGLPIRAGQQALEKIEGYAARAGAMDVVERFSVDESAAIPLKLRVETRFADDLADWMRGQMAARGSAAIERNNLEFYQKRFAGLTATTSLATKDERDANIFTMVEDYTLSKADFDKAKIASDLEFNAYSLRNLMPDRQAGPRLQPLGLPTYAVRNHVIELKVKDRRLWGPADVDATAGKASFSRRSVQDGDVLRITYRFAGGDQLSVPAAEAEAIYALSEKIADASGLTYHIDKAPRLVDAAGMIDPQALAPYRDDLAKVSQLMQAQDQASHVQALTILNQLAGKAARPSPLAGFFDGMKGLALAGLSRKAPAKVALLSSIDQYQGNADMIRLLIALQIDEGDIGAIFKTLNVALKAQPAVISQIVCRQNIWRRSRRRLAERGPRPGVDIKRRACGAASVGVRWSSV